MIKVELANKEELKSFFKNWGLFSCECYNTPKKYAERVGKSCMESGHFSGSRTEYFKFEISGISRACSLQLNRHNIGTVLNQQSQRYVDMANVGFVVPPVIANNETALEIYNKAMEDSKKAYLQIQEILLDSGRSKEQTNEDARYCLLESCETKGTWAFTIEALIHLMNKRLCSRSQWEIIRLVSIMKKEVLEVLPELEQYLQPHCEVLGYCPEDKCCGRKMSKENFNNMVKYFKRNKLEFDNATYI